MLKLKTKKASPQIEITFRGHESRWSPDLWKGMGGAIAAHLLFFVLFRVAFFESTEELPPLKPVKVEIDLSMKSKPTLDTPQISLTPLNHDSFPELLEFPSFEIAPFEEEITQLLPDFTEIEKIPYTPFVDDDYC